MFCRAEAMKKRTDSSPPLSQVHFDALPAAIQRKYFSSFERLKIQQQTPSGGSSRASSPGQPRPGSRHRAHKSENNIHGCALPSSHVDFFLSLPPKLQKQHFSREEQSQLLATREQAQQGLNDFRFGFSEYTAVAAQRQCSSLSPSSPQSPLSTRRQRPPLRLLPFAQEATIKQQESSVFGLDFASPDSAGHTPLKRAMSLSGSTLCRSMSPTVLTGEAPAVSALPGLRHQRTCSASMAARGPSQLALAPGPDTEATHYQDPEARKKLRTYLACPQKFDEAIEFGFPFCADKEATVPHYQLPSIPTHSRKFSHIMQSFLRDGTLSFIEDKKSENQGLEYDADSVTETESPTTPSSADAFFQPSSRQAFQSKYSLDSAGPAPLKSSSGFVNREMTLRMTLTRPDLRADDDQLYGWQSSGSKPVKEDPFALEDLVVTDDATGAKGAFYIKPKTRRNIVNRLFKRTNLKERGRA